MSRKIFLPRSIKGNVKENIPPSTGREELFLPSSPCPLCEMLGCAVLPLVLGFLQLFHLGSCIFISSDDADQSLKLSKPCGCTVSTMDLSEARGLVLFRVVR